MRIFPLSVFARALSGLGLLALALTFGVPMQTTPVRALSITAPDCSLENSTHYFVFRILVGGAYIADVQTDVNGQTLRQLTFLHPKSRQQVLVSKGSHKSDDWKRPITRNIESMVASANKYTLQDMAQSLSYSGAKTEVLKMPRELLTCVRGIN